MSRTQSLGLLYIVWGSVPLLSGARRLWEVYGLSDIVRRYLRCEERWVK